MCTVSSSATCKTEISAVRKCAEVTHLIPFLEIDYACQVVLLADFSEWFVFQITDYGRCPCPLFYCLSDKSSKILEGVVTAGSFPAMPAAALSPALCELSCLKEIGGFFPFLQH